MIDLDGAIDLHVHTAPDVYDRLLDDGELAEVAASAGMRALVLKSHHTLTADRATLANGRSSCSIYGGLALNLTVGGLNPVAVETALAFGARQIWMPTIHARHCLRTANGAMFRAEAEKGYEGLAPFDADGRPAGDLLAILEMIRDGDAILGTGHLAPEESLALLQLARDVGVRRLLVTHPTMSFTSFSVDGMRRAVELGAMLELVALSCHPNWPEAVSPETSAAAVRAVGEEHCILSSDGGQARNEAPPDMLHAFAESLAREGIAEPALARMLKENPARLLGV